ncbi:MAG: hypothetical protein OEV85_07170 [Candidatus Thorarchaeota archaeon]|nr:hypothetical protein [Candidatus Thorarchaeota archaeon]
MDEGIPLTVEKSPRDCGIGHLDLENYEERESIINFAQVPIDAMQESLGRLMGMNLYDVSDWNKIGSKLLLAHEIGSIVFRGIQRLSIQSYELSLILNKMKESSGIDLITYSLVDSQVKHLVILPL